MGQDLSACRPRHDYDARHAASACSCGTLSVRVRAGLRDRTTRPRSSARAAREVVERYGGDRIDDRFRGDAQVLPIRILTRAIRRRLYQCETYCTLILGILGCLRALSPEPQPGENIHVNIEVLVAEVMMLGATTQLSLSLLRSLVPGTGGFGSAFSTSRPPGGR